MESYKKKTVELVSNLALEYKAYPAVISTPPGKGRLLYEDSYRLPRAPHAISENRLYRLLSELEAEERANVHSIVVVKGDAVVLSASRRGFSARMPHLSHSMSKTVCGILILLLVDDGFLDTGASVKSYFPDYEPNDESFYSLTVEHLLSMRSGVSFGEVGSVTEEDWLLGFFTSTMSFAPGEGFAYNSMNSYVLMRIVDVVCREKLGISARGFLERRLFAPLGITNYYWEEDSFGFMKGGWGLYLSTESWARIGIMMLGKGSFRRKRILSERAAVLATSTSARVPEELGDFNYGYQTWVSRSGDDFLFNGMLGQNVWVCPKEELVVAITSGNGELFQRSPALDIIRRTLCNADKNEEENRESSHKIQEKCKSFFAKREWITLHAPLRGLPYLLGIKSSTPFPDQLIPLLGSYTAEENNHGILPIFVRVMSNNYGGGIKGLRFDKHGSALSLTIREGNGEHKLLFGYYAPMHSVLHTGGDVYHALGTVDTAENESGDISYRMELLFPELPNTRRIIISRGSEGHLTLSLREIPDERITDALLAAIPNMSGGGGALYSLLEKNLGRGFVRSRIKELFSPDVIFARDGVEGAEELLRERARAREEKTDSSALIRSLISRFVRDTESESQAKNKLGSFLKLFKK